MNILINAWLQLVVNVHVVIHCVYCSLKCDDDDDDDDDDDYDADADADGCDSLLRHCDNRGQRSLSRGLRS